MTVYERESRFCSIASNHGFWFQVSCPIGRCNRTNFHKLHFSIQNLFSQLQAILSFWRVYFHSFDQPHGCNRDCWIILMVFINSYATWFEIFLRRNQNLISSANGKYFHCKSQANIVGYFDDRFFSFSIFILQWLLIVIFTATIM